MDEKNAVPFQFFKDGHDFFNVNMFRMKLQASSVQVTEPASGCDMNARIVYKM
jgi:hypothetical protein